MKIIHEVKKCIGCGACASNCPKYFKMKGAKAELIKGKKKGDNFELDVKEITPELQDASDSCPAMCILIEK